FFFSSRRRHTRFSRDWSSDVCSSDLANALANSLASAFRSSNRLRLAWQPDANEVFAIMDDDTKKTLKDAGAVFHDWHTPHGYDRSEEHRVGKECKSRVAQEQEKDTHT